jgi:hypothetical protein
MNRRGKIFPLRSISLGQIWWQPVLGSYLSCADEKAPHPFRRAQFFLFSFFLAVWGRWMEGGGRGGASIGECPMFEKLF